MKAISRLLLTVAATLLAFAAAAVGAWEREVQEQINEASYQFRQDGFHKIGETWIDKLGQADDQHITIELDADYEYVAIGVCDGECSDMDLKLYADDDRISEDVGTVNVPILAGSPNDDGEYFLEAVMVDCAAKTCSFGVALFAR